MASKVVRGVFEDALVRRGPVRRVLLYSQGGWQQAGEPFERRRLTDRYIMDQVPDLRNICLLSTPMGDSPTELVRIVEELETNARITSAPVFRSTPMKVIRQRLLEADLIWITAGSAADAVAAWRRHGIDQVLGEAYRQGTVIAGMCGGAMALATEFVSRWMSDPEGSSGEGIGLLPYSFACHVNAESYWNPLQDHFAKVADGRASPGYAIEDGVILNFANEELQEVVTSRPEACAYALGFPGTHPSTARVAPVSLAVVLHTADGIGIANGAEAGSCKPKRSPASIRRRRTGPGVALG